MARKFIFAAALAVFFVGGITTGAGGSPTSVSRICFTVTRTVTEAATSTVTTVSTVISTVTRTVTVTSQGTTSAATTTEPPTTTGTSTVPSGSPMFGIAAGADMQNWSAGTVSRALDDSGAPTPEDARPPRAEPGQVGADPVVGIRRVGEFDPLAGEVE